MNILLFGVSNVGKSATGAILARKLGVGFHDLDEEVKKHLGITLEEFVSTGTLFERDRLRCSLIRSIVSSPGNRVIAITPLSYMDSLRPLLHSPDIFPIVLTDSPENIFDRLVFSDENDVVYKDDDYKNAHKKHYLSEIRKDLAWYGQVYADIPYRFHISGKTPESVADELITTYKLGRKEETGHVPS